jgi:Holliday junction DNA helicase RuvA
MIAKLTGRVDSVSDDGLIVDVGGVGYLVHAPSRVLASLQDGAPISLRIETVVREDAILLYGFLQAADQNWFRLLTTVQGVGAKAALGILSVLTADALVAAIASGDRAALQRAPGVGAKLAARVLSELKDKVGGIVLGVAAARAAAGEATTPAAGLTADAVSGLVNLGYSPSDALRAVTAAAARLGDQISVEALIRAGLNEVTGEARR